MSILFKRHVLSAFWILFALVKDTFGWWLISALGSWGGYGYSSKSVLSMHAGGKDSPHSFPPRE